MRSSSRAGVVAVVAALLAGCTAQTQPPPPTRTDAAPTAEATPEPLPFRLAAPGAPAVVIDTADPVQAAVDVSRAVFAAAPVAVLAGSDDLAGQLTAASAAVALGAPLLLVPPPATARATPAPTGEPAPASTAAGPEAVDDELARLGARAVLAVGAVAAPAGVTAVRVPSGADAADLAAATGRELGAVTPVAPGQEAAAVGALARPGTPVLRAAAAEDSAASSPEDSPPVPPSSPADRSPSSAAGSSAAGSSAAATPAARSSSAPALLGPRATGQPAETLPLTEPAAAAPPATVALVGVGGEPPAALATLRAAGVGLVAVPTGDPRATAGAVEALAAAEPAHVVALGAAFGRPERLAERVAAASTGVQLPGGGQLLFPQDLGQPGKRYVALYGSPGWPALGVLGEQDVPATVARAEEHAAPYRALTADAVVPGVEIIATIASAGAGDDGNYSNERPVAELMPLAQAAGDAGMTVVLDLQPGRTDFLTQAKLYEELLLLPHVSLALDPEWRLRPDQVHLRQIGSVSVDEVNAVGDWLAGLVRDHRLPQKMLILHQFMLRMIDGRERLDTAHDELAFVIHVDGQGGQGAKVGTWNAIRAGAPAGVHWGWKNFYDEDTPAMLDPAGTYAISPTPDLVTYQ